MHNVKSGSLCSIFVCIDATACAFACLWELCVSVRASWECVCWWSCLKENSSDGAWKPCSAAVLPVHRQLHRWGHDARSVSTRLLFPSVLSSPTSSADQKLSVIKIAHSILFALIISPYFSSGTFRSSHTVVEASFAVFTSCFVRESSVPNPEWLSVDVSKCALDGSLINPECVCLVRCQ